MSDKNEFDLKLNDKIRIITQVFNISETEAEKHLDLFSNINPYIKNCLNCLSKIDSDNLRISAAFSLDYLVNFKESAFD